MHFASLFFIASASVKNHKGNKSTISEASVYSSLVKYKTITHSCAGFPTIQNVLQYSVSFFPKIFRGYRKAHDIFEINPFITKLCGTDKIFKTDPEIEAFRTMRC